MCAAAYRFSIARVSSRLQSKSPRSLGLYELATER
jgi:hypothetical protein